MQCQLNYVLSSGRCLPKGSNNLYCEGNTGCIMYYNNGTCQQCVSTFILVNGRCFSRIANCQNYNQYFGQCSSCNSGYILFNNQCYTPGSSEYIAASRAVGLSNNTSQNVTTTTTTTTVSLTRAIQDTTS
jgi:hypothetical protein